jgi:hypothetical protein
MATAADNFRFKQIPSNKLFLETAIGTSKTLENERPHMARKMYSTFEEANFKNKLVSRLELRRR